jgi:uncharacterized membrane protein
LKDNVNILSRVTLAKKQIADLKCHFTAEPGNPVPFFIAQVREKDRLSQRADYCILCQFKPP